MTFESADVNDMGLAHYLVVAGTARVVPGGAAQLLQRLARTFIGPEVRFPPMDDPPPGQVIHIAVERISGVGPWAT
jgi:hypothetical protein